MKKIFTYSLMLSLLGTSLIAQAEDVANVKLFSFTVSPEAVGKTTFFKVSATDGQQVQVDWGNGVKSAATTLADYDAAGWVFTQIDGEVKGTDIVVYGSDPTAVNYIDLSYEQTKAQEAKLLTMDASPLTGTLKEFSVTGNRLSSLNLSANKGIVTLNAGMNALTSITLPENSTIKTVDVSNTDASGEKGTNALAATDWSKLPALGTLKMNYNKSDVPVNLDLSKTTAITTLNANGCNIASVNFTGCSKLKTININENELTELDASMCPTKTIIFANDNKLKSIKTPKGMTRLQVKNNYLTFATLPLMAETGITAAASYVIAPQRPVAVDVQDSKIADLTSLAKVGENETVYTWKNGDQTITEGFTASSGLFIFSGNYTGIVCEMTNAAFPTLTLTTEALNFGAQKLFSFTVAPAAAGKTMTLNISSTDNQSVQVDWGNGTLSNPVATKNYATDWEYGLATGTISGNTITVYGANPSTINQLDLGFDKDNGEETKLLTLDVTPLNGLTDLTASSNALTSLDLSGNSALAKLYINGNNITDIKFPEVCNLTRLEAQNTADAGENDMFKIDLSKAPKLNYIVLNFNNKNGDATTINLDKNTELATIMATDCNLETIDVSKLTKLGQLTVNNNNLKTVDVSVMNSKGRLFAMNNNITSLTLPESLTTLNVSNNRFTFATLPATTVAKTYTYNNQKPMVATAVDGKVDLSSQATVGDVETVFTCAVGADEFKDFTASNGILTFTKSAENAVISMTNAAFPKLTLTTIPVTVKVDGSAVEEIEAADATEAEYFNLQGVKVSGTEPGLYIRRQGNKTEKVIVK